MSDSPPPKSDPVNFNAIIDWLAGLPWWVIIVGIVGVGVTYSVLTSKLYIDALRFITDDPHLLTKDYWHIIERLNDEVGGAVIDGETVWGEIVEETDSETTIKTSSGQEYIISNENLLTGAVAGILVEEDDDTITLRTDDFGTVTVPWSLIDRETLREPAVCALNNLRACDEGIFLTLKATIFSFVLALLIGLVVGMMRISNNPILYAISTIYVEVIRGVPFLVILLYAGFVISPWIRDNTGFELTDVQEAILGLAFGYGAYEAEVFRAGIESISKGQMEAARSLGMNYFQAMRYVILPQAVRVILPPLGNDLISMLKDSALISVLALPDMLQMGRLFISRTFRAFEGYNSVALLYLMMTLFLSMMTRVIERRTKLPG